jgi:MoaA/NifB/PqqE/SkfB family radical SAM enzyme
MELIKNIDQLSKIQMCDLGIATDCDFRCKMCYLWDKKNFEKEILTNEQWIKVIDQIKLLPNKHMTLIFSGGGEILLRSGLGQLLLYASEQFEICLNTNGFLIDQDKAALLAKTVKIINISLDGISPQTHDSLRGVKGSFQRATKAVDLLRSYSQKMIININTVILADNLDEIIELVDWVDSNPINGIIFQAVSNPHNTLYKPDWYKQEYSHLWPKDQEKTDKLIDDLILKKKNGSKIVNSASQLECFKRYFNKPEETIETLNCEVDRALRIDCCGDIQVCCFSQVIGNAVESPLIDILSSELALAEKNKAYRCKNPCHLLVNCFHEQGGQ